MSIEVTILIGLVTGAGGFLLSYFSHRRTRDKDASDAGKNGGMLMADLAYVKAGIDDIKREQREQAKTNMDVVARLVAVEASVKQAHRRLDAAEAKTYPGGKA